MGLRTYSRYATGASAANADTRPRSLASVFNRASAICAPLHKRQKEGLLHSPQVPCHEVEVVILKPHLRMSHVEYLVNLRFVDYEVDGCGKVIHGHFVPGKRPEFVVAWIQACMPLGVGASATIAQPHIEARVGKNETQTLVGEVVDPSVRRVEKAVLEKHHIPTTTHRHRLSRANTVESEVIAIISFNNVFTW